MDAVTPKNSLKLHISSTLEHERGLLANINFQRSSSVARIPFKIALELLDDDPSPFPGADWKTSLAAKLLRELEKGDSSFWKPYLDLLPHNQPIPWLDIEYESFKDIQYEPTIRRITDLQREAIQHYKLCTPSIIANSSYQLFSWALNMVYTHSFTLSSPVSEGSAEYTWRHMFLPVADLLNHDFEPNVAWSLKQRQREHFEVVAKKYIPKGAPLLSKFDDITTESMFLFYGLVPATNKRDPTILFYSLLEAVEWFASRYHHSFQEGAGERVEEEELDMLMEQAVKGITRQLRGVGKPFTHYDVEALAQPAEIDPHDNWHGSALGVYPKAAADHRLVGAFTQLIRFVDGEELPDSEDSWLRDEETAFKVISFRCLELLRSFPSTLQQDRAALQALLQNEHTYSPSWLSAIKLRMVKKRVLQEFVDVHPDYDTPLHHAAHPALHVDVEHFLEHDEF